eukprot:scaffold355586_cov136-Cyclotella_meneghiniana.AAC.1
MGAAGLVPVDCCWVCGWCAEPEAPAVNAKCGIHWAKERVPGAAGVCNFLEVIIVFLLAYAQLDKCDVRG